MTIVDQDVSGSNSPRLRFAHSGWCHVLAARGVWVVPHTFASLGVPYHPPLSLTPLGLVSQDFRLAPDTLFIGDNMRDSYSFNY